ncbi:hypothetical protein Taro_000531 [Colocasia esculenta]|uniref:Uncharacterized protein n=1 Tax=Colocasia esculenta TaxID=4460 RepID=A0A843TF81_COLES|nr:hypothetical protein [Colocasia esculenta]
MMDTRAKQDTDTSPLLGIFVLGRPNRAQKALLGQEGVFVEDFGRFEVLVPFSACSRGEDVVRSGGNAEVSPFFAFYAKKWIPRFGSLSVKATDLTVAFRTRQPDPSCSSSERTVSRRRVLKATVDPIVLRISMAMEWWRLKMQTVFAGRTEDTITWPEFLMPEIVRILGSTAMVEELSSSSTSHSSSQQSEAEVTDLTVAFRMRQPDPSRSSLERAISRRRILKATVDPVVLRIPMAMYDAYRGYLFSWELQVRESKRLLALLLVRSHTIAELGLDHQ